MIVPFAMSSMRANSETRSESRFAESSWGRNKHASYPVLPCLSELFQQEFAYHLVGSGRRRKEFGSGQILGHEGIIYLVMELCGDFSHNQTRGLAILFILPYMENFIFAPISYSTTKINSAR